MLKPGHWEGTTPCDLVSLSLQRLHDPVWLEARKGELRLLSITLFSLLKPKHKLSFKLSSKRKGNAVEKSIGIPNSIQGVRSQRVCLQAPIAMQWVH